MEARSLSIPASALTAPNYRVRNFKIWRRKNKFKFSENFLKKITKNVISGKLQRLEQSQLEARFATLENLRPLWQPQAKRLGNSNIEEIKLNLSFLKTFWKKSQNTSYLKNYKHLSSHIWRLNSQLLGVSWQILAIEVGTSNFMKLFISQFF